MRSQLDVAYAVCRGIARHAAKNFYYGFLVLPREKRDALSAVYAFMRHADDISDDPALTFEQKRARLANWLEHARVVFAGNSTDDPVLMALADAQRRFKIPPERFEQLVYGTAMDIAPAEEGDAPPLAYHTFDELYQYCYHVASVVGLVCIRIFGYRDPRAEALAEKVGVAFQLTNILRDVKEDALLGRVYLPVEDLQRFGRTAAELSPAALANGFDAAPFRPVLEFEAQRAREFYKAADELLPLIDDDGQPALWTLVTIYKRLLEKIALKQYDVFTERVHLSVPEKLMILTKGFVRRIA